jgi:hypothetical protein
MTLQIRVPETELNEVMEWAEQHIDGSTTDNEEGTYEEGVFDTIRWMLGQIHGRPDGV